MINDSVKMVQSVIGNPKMFYTVYAWVPLERIPLKDLFLNREESQVSLILRHLDRQLDAYRPHCRLFLWRRWPIWAPASNILQNFPPWPKLISVQRINMAYVSGSEPSQPRALGSSPRSLDWTQEFPHKKVTVGYNELYLLSSSLEIIRNIFCG